MAFGDALRDELTWLEEKTRVGSATAACWRGDAADERRARDNLESGRIQLAAAHRSAIYGLRALDAGDRRGARALLENAKTLCIDALARQVRPSDLANLGRSAGKRGRPKIKEVAAAPKKKRGRPKK